MYIDIYILQGFVNPQMIPLSHLYIDIYIHTHLFIIYSFININYDILQCLSTVGYFLLIA